MERVAAQQLVDTMRKAATTDSDTRIEFLGDTPLDGFHPWADGKPLLGHFAVSNTKGATYQLLVTEWHAKSKPNNLYLVVCGDGNHPLIEVHKQEGRELLWAYRPSKQDGLNEARKSSFSSEFGSTEVRIALPADDREVPVLT